MRVFSFFFRFDVTEVPFFRDVTPHLWTARYRPFKTAHLSHLHWLEIQEECLGHSTFEDVSKLREPIIQWLGITQKNAYLTSHLTERIFLLLPTWYTNFLFIYTNYIKLNSSTCFERIPPIIRRSLAVAQDSHLQRVTIPEATYVHFASLTSWWWAECARNM